MDIISDIVVELIQAHYKYLSKCEADSTEMEKQVAIIKAKTKELQAQIELKQKYFQIQMQERERLYKSASVVLEKSIEIGDVDMAQIAIRTIKIVSNKSPFSY